MGYTHYWRQDRDFTDVEWAKVTSCAARIVEVCGNNQIRLTREYDDPMPPVINSERIQFNGYGEGGHETFVISRVVPELQPWMNGEHFDFCKTAQKDYDKAVCLVLLSIDHYCPGVMRISSDGNWEDDWNSAAFAFKTIFSEKRKPSCPWGDTN